MKTGNILLGALAGVAVGAVLGILFAPAKGTVTRRRISKKGTDYADGLKEQFNEYVDSVSEQFDSMVEKAADLVDFSGEKVQAAKSETKALK